MQLPSIRTCSDETISFLFWILFEVSEVGSIGLTTATCQYHLHVRSDKVQLEAQLFPLLLIFFWDSGCKEFSFYLHGFSSVSKFELHNECLP